MASSKSGVWEYFEKENNGQGARCQLCRSKTLLKTVGGSTKGLHTHLQSKHQISVLKRKADGGVNGGSTGGVHVPTKNPGPSSNGPMNKYILYDFDRTLGATLSRMTASDGLPFRVFATSTDMRKALAALGFTDLPKTANSIQKIVMEHGRKVRSFVTSEIVQRKASGERFTLTFDEWTSTRNRRYMVVNVHSLGGVFWNLGLVRVHGSMPAEKCVELLEIKLREFEISLSEDIVCICTDGASVMKKVGRLVEAEQQLCYAHGIQLAVLDVLYKSRAQAVSIATSSEEPEIVASACEEDEDCDGDTLEVIDDDIDIVAELSEEYYQVVDKVRKVVRLFRKSPTKNDAALQTYVIREFGHEMSLVLDCRTRWSSLIAMLSRFQTLKNPIQKALIDLKEPDRLTEADFRVIEDLVSSLEPVKLAVSALCRRDINLITAEAALQFCMIQLQKQSSELARTLAMKLESRIKERRALHAGILQYLHNPKAISTDIFAIPSSGTTRKFLHSLLMRLAIFKGSSANTPTEELMETTVVETTSADSDDDVAASISLQEQMECAMNASMQQQQPSSDILRPDAAKTLTAAIKTEMAIFESTGIRGHFLALSYNHLLSIQPTSVEAERAFSAAGFLCTKIRSRLGDSTIDTLCFLRSFYRRPK